MHGAQGNATLLSAALPSPPGGLTDGDWAGCLISFNGPTTLTPPAGYVLVPNTLQTSQHITTGVYYHIWHTGDPTSGLVFQSSAIGHISYICGTYRGVNQNTPFDGANSQSNPAANIATSPTVNGQINDMLLMLYGVLGSPHTFTAASEGAIEDSQSSGPAGAWVDSQLFANGQTGSQSVSFTGNANASDGIQITLVPAS